MDIWHDPYVILLAAHGAALCEHGLWEHGYSQHQTDLHVPLILRWPGVLPAGQRVRRLASLVDLMPTLLEQLRLPPGENLQGRSLVDHIAARLPEAPQWRFAEAVKSGPEQAAVFAEYSKLIVAGVPARRMPDGTTAPGTVRRQLFDLATDPGEQFDVSDQYPKLVGEFTRRLQTMIRASLNTKPGLVVRKAPVDAETVQQLQSLGYVGGQEEDANDVQPESQPVAVPASAPIIDEEDEPNDE
jgi:arylsulfatase A-like enzyme